MAIPYVKNPTWADGSGGGTPINAARLNTIEGGIYDGQLQPAVGVYHNTTQSTTSGVVLTLAFNSERFDQVSGVASTQHDTTTNNSRLTCLYAGIYLIVGNIEWAAAVSTGANDLRIRLNGATVIAKSGSLAVDQRVVSVSRLYSLAVNDYVELQAVQNTGTININSTGNYSPEFSMVRLA